MKKCSVYDQDDIGIRYAALKDRSFMSREEDLLSREERDLRKKFLEFEEHYFECDECSRRLREDRAIRHGIEELGKSGAMKDELSRQKPGYFNLLAVAASILLVTTTTLAVWVGLLSKRARELDTAGRPETVARLFMLEPVAPLERSPEDSIRIPSISGSFLLGVDVSKKETAPYRFEARILNAEGEELWRDEDAAVEPGGKLFVHMGGNFLSPGRYTLEVRVLVRKDGGEQSRGTYPFVVEGTELTRKFHKLPAAPSDPLASSALPLVGRLNVLSSTPPSSSRRAP